MPRLAQAAQGFSGSELSQAVTAALFSAFHGSGVLNTNLLEAEIRGTKPLSVMLAEKVEALRDWARDRTVSAD